MDVPTIVTALGHSMPLSIPQPAQYGVGSWPPDPAIPCVANHLSTHNILCRCRVSIHTPRCHIARVYIAADPIFKPLDCSGNMTSVALVYNQGR